MALRLGDTAPDFEIATTQGTLKFHEWLGNSWGVLFSHPADFTPVCTTEMGRTAQLAHEFARRNAKPIGLSVDPLDDHKAWISDVNETQKTTLEFPIIADEQKKVSELYDMIHPEVSGTATVRSLFIIGPDKKVKLILTYPMSVGRNFDEVLRALDALQLTAEYPVATPADWRPGQQVIVSPKMSNEEADKTFPKGYVELKPYLRFTPQPNL